MVVLNITKRGEYYAKSRNCNGQWFRYAGNEQGKVVEYGKAEDIINSPQAEYTKTLLASVPQIGGQRYV